MSNRKFELSPKIRLNTPLTANMSTTCSCGAHIDPQGDHRFKCKRGNEWDTRHTSLTQFVASIIRSAQPPVSAEINLAEIALPHQAFFLLKAGWT
jgi:hypothetical protein